MRFRPKSQSDETTGIRKAAPPRWLLLEARGRITFTLDEPEDWCGRGDTAAHGSQRAACLEDSQISWRELKLGFVQPVATANGPAGPWLVSNVRQRENFLEKSSRRRSKRQRTAKKNATNGPFKRARIGSEKFSCPQFSCLNSQVRQKDCGQKNFQSRKSLGFHPGGEREILPTAEPVATAQRGGWARDSGRGFYVPSCRAI